MKALSTLQGWQILQKRGRAREIESEKGSQRQGTEYEYDTQNRLCLKNHSGTSTSQTEVSVVFGTFEYDKAGRNKGICSVRTCLIHQIRHRWHFHALWLSELVPAVALGLQSSSRKLSKV